MAALNIFGTSDGTAPASSTTAKANFDAGANRFRSVPMENIVTSGLVLNMDAANAKQGLAPYSNGCASSDLGWFDLSSSSLPGSLLNFSSCGSSSGWVGAGSVASPYALAFDGSNDYASLGATVAPATGLTISAWIKPASTTAGIIYFSGPKTGCSPSSKDLRTSGGKLQVFVGCGSTISSTGSLTTGSWAHVGWVFDSNKKTTLYINGSLDTSAVDNASGQSMGTGNDMIGANYDSGSITKYFNGSISALQLYNAELTAKELKQNCLAQEGRFTSTAQSICGAP
jgi:hypothetical protein